jgi:alkylation response protein AidB-like acyl-CoA dehydrogenase
VGKVHQGELNQRIQLLATDLLGAGATGSPGTGSAVSTSYADGIAYEVRGMLRSRANTIEGGTTEINKNVIGERILGLPREPDPSATLAWREVPRS